MKRLLLLGDSIRMSYQSHVQEMLAAEAETIWPEDNCRYAKYTLWHITEWIDKLGNPEIIHWNNGLWDIYRINNDIGIFTDKAEYVYYLGRILRVLRKTGAKIIWASLTAVDDRNPNCRNEDIDDYNRAASEFMQLEGIDIDDLSYVVKKDIGHYISDDFLHLSLAGERACAAAVADSVRRYL